MLILVIFFLQLKQLVSPAQLQSNKRRSFYVEEPFANHKAINVSSKQNLFSIARMKYLTGQAPTAIIPNGMSS